LGYHCSSTRHRYLYEPANKVFVQGLVAGITNSVTVAIAGTILLVVYARTQVKSGSLSKTNKIG
jgi:uncharacterized membrane protein